MIKAAETPTLRDIAREVGVTPTTVSLALRNNPRISAPTRRKVRQTAEDMGYRPNAELSRMMASLKTRQNRDVRPVIALVADAARGRSVRGIAQTIAEAAGYGLDLIEISQSGMHAERIAGVLRARGIRGAVLYRINVDASAAGEWMEDLAFCCIGHPPSGTNIPACDWARDAGPARSEEPLFCAAVDVLDLAMRRNRFGDAPHGMSLKLH